MTGADIMLADLAAEPHAVLRWTFDVAELQVTVRSNTRGLVWDVQWHDHGYRDGVGVQPDLQRALEQRVAEELARTRLARVLADLDRARHAWPDR